MLSNNPVLSQLNFQSIALPNRPVEISNLPIKPAGDWANLRFGHSSEPTNTDDAYDYWKPQIQSKIDAYNKAFDLNSFGLESIQGIPPALKRGDKNTNGIILQAVIEIIESLPNATNRASRESQIWAAIITIDKIAGERAKLLKEQDKLPDDVEPSEGIGATAPDIYTLRRPVSGTIYRRHLMFINDLGAIQIVKIPSIPEIINMLKPTLFRNLDTVIHEMVQNYSEELGLSGKQSLKDISVQKKMDLLVRCLNSEIEYISEYKDGSPGWSAVHEFFLNADLDYKRLMPMLSGSIVFNRPGKDPNRDVWNQPISS